MRLALHAAADRELTESAVYLEQQRPRLGDEFLDAFDVVRRELVDFPLRGRPAEEGARRIRIGKFSYDIVYILRNGSIVVVAIAHQRRRPGYWRSRLR